MKVLGIITAIVMGAAGLAAAIIGVRSAPDINRYRKMRAM